MGGSMNCGFLLATASPPPVTLVWLPGDCLSCLDLGGSLDEMTGGSEPFKDNNVPCAL